jgi:hypothetical protein
MVSSKVDKGDKTAIMKKSATLLHRGCNLAFDPLSVWLPANEKPDRQTLQFEARRRGVGKLPAKTLGRDGLIVYLMAQDAPPPLTDEDLSHDDAAPASQPPPKSSQNGADSDEGEPRDAGAAAGQGDAKRARVEPALVVPIPPSTGGGGEKDVAAEKLAASGESETGAAEKTGKAAGKGKGEATKADDGTANWRTNNGVTQLANIIIRHLPLFVGRNGQKSRLQLDGASQAGHKPKNDFYVAALKLFTDPE